MSVGIVVVSHSEPLAKAAVELANIMVHNNPPAVAIAAGVEGDFGTDTTAIMEAISQVDSGDGVAIFVDMGSAVMSAETAIDLLDSDARITAAPFVEGITAGIVAAAMGSSLDQVISEAERSLDAKRSVLGLPPLGTGATAQGGAAAASCPADAGDATGEAKIVNEVGLHARPAAGFANLAASFDAEVTVSTDAGDEAEADSIISLMALGAELGTVLKFSATGPQASEAVAALVEFVQSGMGEDPVA